MNTITLYWLGRPQDAEPIFATGFRDVPVGTAADGAPWLGVFLIEEHGLLKAGEPGLEAVLRVTVSLPDEEVDRYALHEGRMPAGDYCVPAERLNDGNATITRLMPEDVEILRAERSSAWAEQTRGHADLDNLDRDEPRPPKGA